VNWWHYVVLVADLGIALMLVPWLVARLVDWWRCRAGACQRQAERASRLRAIADGERAFWPDTPREGRFGDGDRLAAAQFARFAELADQADGLLAAAQATPCESLSLAALAKLAGWPRLIQVLAGWQATRAAERALDGAQAALDGVLEARRLVTSIPQDVRAHLSTLRAEDMRLQTLIEEEREAGTAGLDELDTRLRGLQDDLEDGLAALGAQGTAPSEESVSAAVCLAEQVAPTVAAIDEQVRATIASRERMQERYRRVAQNVASLRERWMALQTLGVTEPSWGRAVEELEGELAGVVALQAPRTLVAFESAIEACDALGERANVFGEQLGQLGEWVERAREAIAGDLQRLADAQSSVEDLTAQDSALDPDISIALVERASQWYTEAEQLRAQGTLEGYQRACERAGQARKGLDEARERLVSFPAMVADIKDDLCFLSGQVLSDWRLRAERLREELAQYSAHWSGGLAGRATEALAALEEVEVALERLSPNVRYQRRFRQSEMDDAKTLLESAAQMLARGQAMVGELEEDLLRIEGQRQQLEERLVEIKREVWPPLEQVADRMLPGLRDRYHALTEGYRAKLDEFADPARVNYDQAVNIWLPDLLAATSELMASYQRDVQHYGRLAKERRANLERKWSRLVKLEPLQTPLPEENVERLERDLDRWRLDVDKLADNLPELRDAIGRRADALEERVDGALRQVEEGRAQMRGLAKRFERHGQVVRAAQTRLRDLERASAWPRLRWERDAVEELWEDATLQQRGAQSSPTLREAAQRLDEAVTTAQRAEEAYGRAVKEMETTLQGLSDDLRRAELILGRGLRQVDRLEAESMADEAEQLRKLCDRAQELLDSAQEATDAEEAQQALREAREVFS
jgi:hypothetical protein